ncbi:Indoleamine 2,3-dioxygenase [Savitreella phatthalungensis]
MPSIVMPIIHAIPKLEDYGLSAETGFLPEEPPLLRLPQKYYRPWETIMESFNALLLADRLKEVVDDMPVLSADHLRNDAERRRAFLLLSFIAHGYVWGGKFAAEVLPASIAVPWDRVAAALEVRPVCSHASVCLWNFRPIFAEEPLSLTNLMTLYTFTGSLDESWFYLVSTAMESRGAPTLPIILSAMRSVRANSIKEVTYGLRALAIHIDDMAVALTRMHDKCDPHIFYNKVRPFLAGWRNMAEAGLPQGLRYEGCEDHADGAFRNYSGGSNAQSALIHMLDVALGVEHHQTGDGKLQTIQAISPRNDFMIDMRNYMPANHRRFLEHLEQVANIREFCLEHKDDAILSEAYDACLAMLKAFRDKHLAIVSRFILIPASNARRQASADSRPGTGISATSGTSTPKGLASVISESRSQLKGTGGTNLMAFLKQTRDETGQMAVSNWAKVLMANDYGHADLSNCDERLFIGLNGAEVDDWTEGGICSA